MAIVLPDFRIPIKERTTPRSWRQTLAAIAFFIVFNFGCIMIHASQFVFLLPLRLIPLPLFRKMYDEGIRYTKGAFGCLLILMCQWFAPTTFHITFEREGLGAFTQAQIDEIVVRNEDGGVEALNLPNKFVLVANHQVYLDWWYVWCLFYYMGPHGAHRDVYITLKKSLQWVPIIGWGMQFFNFIFLARSWASDRAQLAASLASLSKTVEEEDTPLAFVLYPEGTLVSPNTRPISKKFADKLGISDMDYTLLPRSTGLLYSLRSLAPRLPDLKLLDVTMVYPGIATLGTGRSPYGQDYYTMRSVFFDGVQPPTVHLHLRLFDVRSVPIGDMSASNPAATPSLDKSAVEVDIPVQEKEAFDEWLRILWKNKDESIERFHKDGSFVNGPKPDALIPLKLKHRRNYFDAFCFFLPAMLGHLWRCGGAAAH
ncbi:hypothetical protein FISHEDRAFT_49261 [Fistulina hepatica ATCC 64428]|uniref:Phospholipid/glycerol acyltransferase domain-containing protein n=1 Tax=Fistulina hepatica ATCC 64428 TaxID=1128425 RepID=A0A0D7A631_9AGAR|nr:hypothetical protein FISHEDRAFT_49261 [Fistulina hepatica ATCC 64428]